MYDKHWYIFADLDASAAEISILTPISLYLICNYLMTLDLAVMLELVAIWYSPFVSIDAKMTKSNERLGTVETAQMNSLNLIENLGEVEYIMSDKTGTLTKNALTLAAAYCCEQDKTGTAYMDKKTLGEYLNNKSEFLQCLLLCHDCTILELPTKDGMKKLLTGASLDEQCLLNAVHETKVAAFKQRTANTIEI